MDPITIKPEKRAPGNLNCACLSLDPNLVPDKNDWLFFRVMFQMNCTFAGQLKNVSGPLSGVHDSFFPPQIKMFPQLFPHDTQVFLYCHRVPVIISSEVLDFPVTNIFKKKKKLNEFSPCSLGFFGLLTNLISCVHSLSVEN